MKAWKPREGTVTDEPGYRLHRREDLISNLRLQTAEIELLRRMVDWLIDRLNDESGVHGCPPDMMGRGCHPEDYGDGIGAEGDGEPDCTICWLNTAKEVCAE